MSATSAKLNIKHSGTTEQQLLDLTAGACGFVELGTFYFDGLGAEFVSLAQGTLGTLRADAVRFTKVQ